MLKLIEIDSHYFNDEPNVRLLNPESISGLVKQAADSSILDFARTLQTEPDKVYVHILAMGASEAWGANRNADSFPEQQLLAFHKTFETSPAHIFRNHVNKDPDIAIGKVVHSVYNQRMRRVELIAWIDKQKGADIVERIERGEFPATSMACKTPYDVCSICGNKAHTRQEYCTHLTNELGRIYPDGRKVSALNVASLKFFDMSVVIRPADVTSAVLQKLASSRHVVGSAEMAETYGLSEKTASHAKLSEMIKEIDDGLIVDSGGFDEILAKVKDPSADAIRELSKFELGEVISAMAFLGISPSVAFLADLIGYRIVGEEGLGVGHVIESYISANGLKDIHLSSPANSNAGVNTRVVSILAPHVKSASLFQEEVINRVLGPDGATYAPGTNAGYIGNGPHVEETSEEYWNRLSLHPVVGPSLPAMLKTLVLIAGAALAAKWSITREIDQRAKENTIAERKVYVDSHPGAKIVLVKSALSPEYQSLTKLAKYAMAKAIKKA